MSAEYAGMMFDAQGPENFTHEFKQVWDEDRCYCGLPVDAPQHSRHIKQQPTPIEGGMNTTEEAKECLEDDWGKYQSLRVVTRLLARLEEVQEWFAFYNGDSDIGPQGWYKLERILDK